ncbi:hypothetical protein ACHAXA_007895 [Cyclostephanos tholiformis]|uniref:Alpha/beta hydrolase fold-3 domain-containing protein n=1 Tax=Cyclostephanos tholiformis TaxID=382380 RepID=A0ABD3SH67_9STRA
MLQTMKILNPASIVAAFGESAALSPHPQASDSTDSTTTISSLFSSDEDAADASRLDHDNNLREYFSAANVERMDKIAADENERLNLNLGMPVDLTVFTRRDVAPTGVVQKVLRPPVRTLLRILDSLLAYIESPIFRFWSNRVPLRLRQKLTFLAWGMYLPIHKTLVGRRTGLHRDVSLECHALTSIMYWGRLFPVTVKRMRFSLSQLHVWHPPDQYPQWTLTGHSLETDAVLNKPRNGNRYGIRGHLHEVHHRMKLKRTPTGFRNSTKDASIEDMVVTGQFVQHSSLPSQKVIFWIFGGAFLGGDSKGNLGIAEKMGMLCTNRDKNNRCYDDMRDVFIPDYRLVPEHHLDDAVHDIALAYEYLIYERHIQPDDISLVGVSSGGGLVVLLLQALAKARREFEETSNENDENYCESSSRVVPMPAGGVLMGPFVDYTEPKGSMKEYIKHDLIVNQSVYDEGIPYLEKVLGSHENRVKASPVFGSFEGLPPLCICVSKHEVVFDQAMLLAKRAKEQGVDVTVGVWKYM